MVAQTPQVATDLNGRLHFFWGGSAFDSLPDFSIVRRGPSSVYSDLFGSVMTGPGDMSGDGFSNIFVASDGLDDTAWVYYGGPTIDDIPDVIIPTYLQNAGPAGDINRDGYDDLIASTYSQFSGHGAVFIWYGGPDFDSLPDVRIFNSDNQDYETYFGQSAIEQLDAWRKGPVLDDGTRFGPALVHWDRQGSSEPWIEVVLREGQKRQLRRSAEALGLRVRRLIRTEFCGLNLGGLRPGEWRNLTDAELRVLRQDALRGAGVRRPTTGRSKVEKVGNR